MDSKEITVKLEGLAKDPFLVRDLKAEITK